jgi:predicted NodU family carbamoyl transferase
MIILGILTGQSAHKRPLRDGASALVVDGKLVCAIPEERVTRTKRAGGWVKSTKYCLDATGVNYKDVDVVAFSTCCDSTKELPPDITLIREIFPSASIVRVPHHLSHAVYAFYASKFERS